MKTNLIGLSILLGATGASAQSLLVPAFRGEADTAYSAWDVFAATTAAAPDLAGTLGTVSELTGSSFLTSGGNLYNAGAASVFDLSITLDFDVERVLFQTLTQGTELDYGAVFLRYEDPVAGTVELGAASTVDLGSVPLGGFGGSAVGTAFTWDLGALGVTDFTIRFAATGPHLSLDRVSLDVGSGPLAVVPEPAGLGLWLGAGGLLLGLRRRR